MQAARMSLRERVHSQAAGSGSASRSPNAEIGSIDIARSQQLSRRAFQMQPPRCKNIGTVGDLKSKVYVLLNQADSCAAVSQPCQEIENRFHDLRSKPEGRLVEEQQPWRGTQGTRNGQL